MDTIEEDVEHFAFASPDCSCKICIDIRDEENY